MSKTDLSGAVYLRRETNSQTLTTTCSKTSFQFVVPLTSTLGFLSVAVPYELLQLGKSVQFWIRLWRFPAHVSGCSPEQNRAGWCCKGGVCCLSAHSLPEGFAFLFSVNISLFLGHSQAPLMTRVQLSWVPSVKIIQWCWKCALPWKVHLIFHWRGCDFQKIQRKKMLRFWFLVCVLLCEINTC